MSYIGGIPPDVQYFLRKVQEFYIEAASQTKNRFPIGDPKIKLLQVIDPNAVFPSLVPLATRFPNLNLKASKISPLLRSPRKIPCYLSTYLLIVHTAFNKKLTENPPPSGLRSF